MTSWSRLIDLTNKRIEKFIGQMWDAGYGSGTIDLRLETPRHVLNRAADIIDLTKMPLAIHLLGEPRPDPKYVVPANLKKWMSYISPDHCLRAGLSYFTGVSEPCSKSKKNKIKAANPEKLHCLLQPMFYNSVSSDAICAPLWKSRATAYHDRS
jgi:hypothetical protein